MQELSDAESNDESEGLVNTHQLAHYWLFTVGAVRRHKALAGAVLFSVLGMTAAVAALWPRTYRVDMKLLAQRNAVMTALSNPGRAVPWDADAPTKAAAETVLRRDNLVAIINKTNLVEEWARTRAPILRVKDLITDFLRGRKQTTDEKLDRLVELLEARMIVSAGPIGEGAVSIELLWPDAEMAYRLVQEAQGMFLDARQKAETAAINESIRILERYSDQLHDDANKTMAELERSKTHKRPVLAAAKSVGASASETAPGVPSVSDILPPLPEAALGSPLMGTDLDDPELPRLRNSINAKRQEMASLEESRQKQLTELQAKLSQLTTMYTASHPAVMTVQQNISTLSHDSPQLTLLKAALEKLEADYAKREEVAQERLQEKQRSAELSQQPSEPGSVPEPVSQPAKPARTAPAPPVVVQVNTKNDDDTDFASVRFRLQLNQLQSVLERTDGARIELAVSNAAFKYRYTIIRPAQVPREPNTPNARLILAVGFIGSILLSLAAVVTKDLLSNRIFQAWQVEQQLGLPVLATLGNA
jgi:hypothetical protein